MPISNLKYCHIQLAQFNHVFLVRLKEMTVTEKKKKSDQLKVQHTYQIDQSGACVTPGLPRHRLAQPITVLQIQTN